jgi:hypothetical protein
MLQRPFFRYPVELRRIIYTTNAIESLHSQMRKNIAGRKVFPHDDSVIKILFLNIRNFTNRWIRPQGWDIVMSQLLVPVRRSPQVPLGRFSLNSLAPPLTQLLLQPHINGRPRGYYIIDFGTDMTLQDASFYELPFKYVTQHVREKRSLNNRELYRTRWWIHAERDLRCARY